MNKQLTLYNYRLESAHSQAFAKTCQVISDRISTSSFLTKILFDNCGLIDIDFAELLKGISKLQTLSQIIYRKNELGEYSVTQLRPILRRPFGKNHLQDLRIVNCKISSTTSLQLLECLRDDSHLKSLALVNANMKEGHSSVLKEYIEKSKSLENLDISWNYLTHLGYIGIVQACVDNKNLISLNLSHNSLIQSDNTKLGNETDTTPLV